MGAIAFSGGPWLIRSRKYADQVAGPIEVESQFWREASQATPRQVLTGRRGSLRAEAIPVC